MSNRELIRAENLEIQRGRFALRIPDWRLETGQVVGLVGPNGAGKTTLLEAFAGLRTTDSGTLSVLGRDPSKDATVRTELGFMSDDMPLFTMRIGQLLRHLSGYYRNWDADLVETLLERFKLNPTDKVHKLSKGQGTRLRLITMSMENGCRPESRPSVPQHQAGHCGSLLPWQSHDGAGGGLRARPCWSAPWPPGSSSPTPA